MVDIIPESQTVIGHGAFSVVYRAKLKAVSPICYLIAKKSPHYYRHFYQNDLKLSCTLKKISGFLDVLNGVFLRNL